MIAPFALKPPFPWFGGKSRAADAIWKRFGNVPNYVEPFAGSLAVMLNRPHEPKIETVNDKDSYLANFWRALKYDPNGLCHYADWPVNEADLHARHKWLLAQSDFRERMTTDPDYYDVKIAGWWVWGLCQWIGSGWCSEDYYNDDGKQKRPHLGDAGRGIHRPSQKLPHLGDAGRGIHRPSQKLPHLGNPGRGIHRPKQQRPHLGNPGMGIHRPAQQLPHLGNPGRGIHRPAQQLPHLGNPGRGDQLLAYFNALSNRLRNVRVCCGDWSRVLGESPTVKLGMTAVLLDPPYSDEAGRDNSLYGIDDDSIAHNVRQWAIENGDNPLLRIALCGYESEHTEHMPDSWEVYHWKTSGGYGSQGNGTGRENAVRETIWFSPACLKHEMQLTMPL